MTLAKTHGYLWVFFNFLFSSIIQAINPSIIKSQGEIVRNFSTVLLLSSRLKLRAQR